MQGTKNKSEVESKDVSERNAHEHLPGNLNAKPRHHGDERGTEQCSQTARSLAAPPKGLADSTSECTATESASLKHS